MQDAKWFYEAANEAARRAILAGRAGAVGIEARARTEAADFRARARELARQDQRQGTSAAP